jgi:succinate-acetate transporter protein
VTVRGTPGVASESIGSSVNHEEDMMTGPFATAPGGDLSTAASTVPRGNTDRNPDLSDQTHREPERFWGERTRVVLSPVAAPSILGLFGFAVSTFMVSANLAGWYGDNATPLVLFPFALAFGGIAQLLAAMWSFKARDALASAVHGAWGSFWIGYGIYVLLVAVHVLPGPTAARFTEAGFGYWFIGLAAITFSGMLAAFGENLALSSVLATLFAGSALLAIGLVVPLSFLVPIGAIVLVASAVLAWYTATAMMLQAIYHRPVLPVGALQRPDAAPASARTSIDCLDTEPGVKIGQ